MADCKPVGTPMDPGVRLSKDTSPTTDAERASMKDIPYINAVGALMYLATATRPDIANTVSIHARFSSNLGMTHWAVVKHLMRYKTTTPGTRRVSAGSCLLKYKPRPNTLLFYMSVYIWKILNVKSNGQSLPETKACLVVVIELGFEANVADTLPYVELEGPVKVRGSALDAQGSCMPISLVQHEVACMLHHADSAHCEG